MAERAKLTVVIPTYNRSDLLGYTLKSLLRQSLPVERFEVVVADDGSSDGTRDVVSEFAKSLRMRYVFLPRDEDEIAAKGYCVSRVRNRGAALATAPVLVFMDTGVVAGHDFLAAHLAGHRVESSGPGEAVLGYTYGTHKLMPLRSLEELLRCQTPEQVVAAIGAGPRGLDLRHPQLRRSGFDITGYSGSWTLFWTLNASVSTSDFLAVGGFDEAFRGWGFEDTELGYRLARHGVRMSLSREAWAIEWPLRPDVAGNDRSSIRNFQHFLTKHRDPEIEITVNVRSRYPLEQFELRRAELEEWAARAAPIDVLPELEAVERDLRTLPARIAVVGCGGVVPRHWPASTLIDFDAELLARAAAGTGHTALRGLGLHTGLPDGAADLVVVTSRLAGLWDRWGNELMAEAHRVGAQVRAPALVAASR
ncbi:glycosyltransferase [Micromonospora sp. CPCC 206061]|uniref:glycosyltransferase n=1 Tax=Micromonospora sp. CPCC 206061 TaxID=3122410 RepID=UPI002FEFD733